MFQNHDDKIELLKYYRYILSNKNRTLLHVGYSDNLVRRFGEHKNGIGALITRKYNVNELIYFENFINSNLARNREKRLKNWHKEWKWNLIKETNPKLKTLDIN